MAALVPFARRVSAVAIAASVLTGAAAHAASGWLLYRHPRHGFTIRYPSSWSLGADTGPLALMLVGPPNAAGGRLNVVVGVEAVPPGTAIEALARIVEEKQRQLYHAYRILRTDRAVLDGTPVVVQYVTWRANSGQEPYHVQLLALDEARGYVVVGTTVTSPAIRDEAGLLLQIVTSFRPR